MRFVSEIFNSSYNVCYLIHTTSVTLHKINYKHIFSRIKPCLLLKPLFYYLIIFCRKWGKEEIEE